MYKVNLTCDTNVYTVYPNHFLTVSLHNSLLHYTITIEIHVHVQNYRVSPYYDI